MGAGDLTYDALAELLGAMQLGAVVVGYDQVVRHANGAAARIIGAGSAAEIIGKSCLLHCPSEPGCCTALDRGQASGIMEKTLLDRQGNAIPILKAITPIRLEGEEVLLETFLDYAERKKTEETLLYQKTLLVSIGEASLDGILVVSPAREIVYSNRRFARMWGIPDHVIEAGSDWAAVQYVLDRLADPDGFLKRLKHLYQYCDSRGRDEIRLKDGRTIDRYTAPVMDMAGQFYGRVWYFRDITSRVHAEKEVAGARAFLQEVVDGIADPTMVVGLDYRVWTMNRAAREVSLMQGRRRDTVCPVMCHEISHHVGRPCRPEDGHPCPLRDVAALKGPVTEVHEHFLPDGERRVVEIAAAPLFGPDGNVRAVVESSRDITARVLAEEALRESERRMEHLAHHDALTGLPNRLLFNDRLDRALALARRKGGRAAVMLFDLDRFKAVNDSLGHPAGDRMLQEVAKRLAGRMRESDTLARVGGDEFCIIAPELAGPEQAATLARRVLDTGDAPYQVDGVELRVTISMGIAVYPEHGGDATTLMKNADVALYLAKDDGRDNIKVYSPGGPPEAT